MKRILIVAMLTFALCASGFQANAQSKLDKLVGTWLMTTDFNGQTMELTYKIVKNDDGVFATMDMPGAPEQQLEIKDVNGKLQSLLDIPEFGAAIDISYAFVDDDTVNVSVDAGGFMMESSMTRVKE